MKHRIHWWRVGSSLAVLCLVATISSVIAAVIWEGADGEMVGLGLLVLPFLLPALVAYVLASAIWPRRRIRHVAFWILLLAAMGLFVPTALFPSAGASGDGVDELALAFLVPLTAGGLLTYVFEQLMELAHPRRLTVTRHDVCAACGYPIGVSKTCTECGHSLAQPSES